MLRQNSILNQKIEKLQLTLEEGLSKLESNNGSNNLDQTFIDVISLYCNYVLMSNCNYNITFA